MCLGSTLELKNVPSRVFPSLTETPKTQEANSVNNKKPWSKKTDTREEKLPNLIFTQRQFHTHTNRFAACKKRERERLELHCVSSFISLLHSHGVFVSSLILVDVWVVCSALYIFQVAVTGAPPGQDPWGVIEDAHSLGASALLSHVGEKHLWWPALLQNR